MLDLYLNAFSKLSQNSRLHDPQTRKMTWALMVYAKVSHLGGSGVCPPKPKNKLTESSETDGEKRKRYNVIKR